MFLKSELSEIGEKFMFVILSNIVYHAGNISDENNCNGNFLCINKRKFPLQKSTDLESLEKRYFEKARAEIEQFKSDCARQQKIDRQAMIEEIEKNEFLRFYLFNVQTYYAEDVAKKLGVERLVRREEKREEENKPVMIEILSEYDGNVGILNRRIFPLKQVSEYDPCVVIEGQVYGFMESQSVLEEFESRFQSKLELRLKEQVLREISQLEEQRQELSSLEESLAEMINICRVNRHSYEYGNIGFDLKSKYIYWLPPSGNGNNAIGTPLKKADGKIVIASPVSRNMMSRKNRGSAFGIGDVPCIIIETPNADDVKAVINYLKECADTKF